MEENQTMEWTIINSINLAKLYPLNDTSISLYSSLKFYDQLSQFFNEFKIPYYLINNKLTKNNNAYFGKAVNFQNLYIIAGIIKSYGYNHFYYNPKLIEKITIGSPNRTNINQRKTCIEIDSILSLPFYTDMKDVISDLFANSATKVDINDYGIKSGLITEEDIHGSDYQMADYDEDDFENDKSSNYESSYDPYQNFHWGGLSGEEAHTAYWNCD